ncbi:MAG TPA: PLP-dependent aspartate aminotransferase family protein [Ignavibacteriaceae bacterium]|nr:PLP-dependent aspartate aminotransferase family protein [Ignavibacteriaceae bacterium]
MGFSTDAIHKGQEPDPSTGAIITPIFQTSTFALEELGKDKGYHYARSQNPTRKALEQNIAALEKGKHGIAFGAGIAAINSIMSLLKSGDHVVISNNVYGGTYRLYEQVLTNYGITFSWVDTNNLAEVENSIKDNSKIIYVESPTNPMLNLTDLKAISDLCKKHNLISVCDNTFMSPYFQNPLKFGIDIVLHSTTKYLNGHSDVIGGFLVTNNDELNQKIRFYQNASGAVPSPFDCWLVLRSTKTLAVRMERHNANAIKFAEYLCSSKVAEKVYYPGLPSHPQHELAKKQMRGFGGMVSADFGDFEISKKLLNNVKLFSLAESLGGVESLVNQPATMTHGSVPREERLKLGITDSLVRFSIGLEDIEDLIKDVEMALK